MGRDLSNLARGLLLTLFVDFRKCVYWVNVIDFEILKTMVVIRF